jgi:hypothetical protein
MLRSVIAGPYMNTYRPRDITDNPVILSKARFYRAISTSLPLISSSHRTDYCLHLYTLIDAIMAKDSDISRTLI